MEGTAAVRTARHRQLLLAALAAVWFVGGATFIVALELREFEPGDARSTFALRLGALLLQLLIAVSSTALLLWTRHQRKAELLARQHGEEFRQLFHKAVEAMFVTSASLRLIEVNDAAVRLTGYSRDEMLAMSLREFVPADEMSARPFRVADLLAGARIESERRIACKDGGQRNVEFSVQRLPDGRILGVVRDVTGRREVERRLRLLSRALEESPAAMVITDVAGRIEYINPSFSKVTGWALAEAVGQTPALLKSGRTPDAVYRELWETIRAGGEWRGEIQNRRKNGEIFPWILSIHPILDEQGQIEHFLGVGEDASERRSAERSLEETRTALYQAQKMEALGRLAGGVAHDFNNLLGIILGCSDMLSASLGEGSPGRGEIAEIRKAVQRASDLTRQMLAFSRRQVLEVRIVDLAGLLEDSRRMLSRLLPESIDLGLAVDPGLWSVRADSTQLVQVLINLAVNARDAMPMGGELRVSAANACLGEAEAEAHGLAPGDYVRLNVRDSGEGMTPDVVEHAFEPFFTTRAALGGTGLGLATVYGIVQQLGGAIEVDSSPTSGTTMILYLPRVARSDSGERVLGPGAVPPVVLARVLVVEDLAPLRLLVERMLTQIGYSVHSAASAQEALALSGEGGRDFDLLLSDIVMPGMDGRDLARLMKAARPDLRIVLMTGYSDLFAETSDPRELGVDAIVQKPFSREQISQVLARVLSGSEDGRNVS